MAYSFLRKNIIEFDSIAVLTGDGSNGKSIVTSILRALHGDNVSNVPLDLMSDDKFAASHTVNKDVNIDTEVRPKMTTMLKKLTGSHPIWVQEKGEKGFDALLHAKIWLSGNNLKITDGSGASDRRLRFISFKRKFEAKQADKNLTEKLLAEAPRIFNMLMHNLR
jgi:putative DNA primase/helicase